MPAEFEMVALKEKHAIKLNQVSEPVRQNVLRLLKREELEVMGGTSNRDSTFCLYVNPHSVLAFVWSLLFIAVFYLVQLQISLSLAFGPSFFAQELELGSFYFPVYISFLVFLLLDIGLCFFKGYYAFGKGKVVDQQPKIAINYLKTQFAYDIVAVSIYTVPLIYNSYALNFLQLITAGLLWIKKFKYQNEVETYLEYRSGARATFMLLVLFIDVLMIGNYGACLFIGMDLLLYREAVYGTGEDSAYYWLTSNTAYPVSLIYGPWYYQYIYGQEFSTGTLSTMAPGPFGKNPYQILYSMLVMIFFVVLASYVAEVIIMIAYTYTQRRTFHEDNIITFDNFMQLKQVARGIRKRVYNYFELIWEVELKMETKEQEQMITKLPLYLKEELLLQIGFTKYLYFLEDFPQEYTLKKMISLRIARTTVDADTMVFEAHQTGTVFTRALFFIREGMAKFFLPAGRAQKGSYETVLSLTNVERVFGVYEFLTGQLHCLSCQSIDLCLLQTLEWEDFKTIVQDLHLVEQIQQLQARVLVERELGLLKKACVVCGQTHIEAECTELYPRERIVAGVKFDNAWGSNRRGQYKRKRLAQQKVVSVADPIFGADLFGLIPGVDLGQLLMDLYKMGGHNLDELEVAADYDSYFKNYNVIDYF